MEIDMEILHNVVKDITSSKGRGGLTRKLYFKLLGFNPIQLIKYEAKAKELDKGFLSEGIEGVINYLGLPINIERDLIVKKHTVPIYTKTGEFDSELNKTLVTVYSLRSVTKQPYTSEPGEIPACRIATTTDDKVFFRSLKAAGRYYIMDQRGPDVKFYEPKGYRSNPGW